MNLTSEQVHWIYGGVLVAAAVLLILREYGRIETPWLDYVTPILLLLFGVELALDPLVHGTALPTHYARETAQHLALGILLVVTGAAEIVRLRRKGSGWPWRLPLSAALMIAAGVFAFHAQHDSQAPMMLLMVQHRTIAATLVLASLAFFFAPPGERSRAPSAFSVLILLLGAQVLLYTEGNFLFGAPMPMQPMGM